MLQWYCTFVRLDISHFGWPPTYSAGIERGPLSTALWDWVCASVNPSVWALCNVPLKWLSLTAVLLLAFVHLSVNANYTRLESRWLWRISVAESRLLYPDSSLPCALIKLSDWEHSTRFPRQEAVQHINDVSVLNRGYSYPWSTVYTRKENRYFLSFRNYWLSPNHFPFSIWIQVPIILFIEQIQM